MWRTLLSIQKKFSAFLFINIPIEIRSDFSRGDAIERLRSCNERNLFQYFIHGGSYFSVTKEKIKIKRMAPLIGNPFKPVFVGEFVDFGGVEVLVGKFSLARIVKTIAIAWLSIAFSWLLIVLLIFLISFIGNKTQNYSVIIMYKFILIGVLFFFTGVVCIHLFWRMSRGDMIYLERHIRRAIQIDYSSYDEVEGRK